MDLQFRLDSSAAETIEAIERRSNLSIHQIIAGLAVKFGIEPQPDIEFTRDALMLCWDGGYTAFVQRDLSIEWLQGAPDIAREIQDILKPLGGPNLLYMPAKTHGAN